MRQLPTIITDRVWHVGALRGRAQARVASHEGHCLSVSHCPAAWARIARLDSTTLWDLRKPEATFVDMLAVEQSTHLRKLVVAWGAREQLCHMATQWKSWFRDEDDEWRYTLHDTAHEAHQEAAFNEVGEGPDGPAVQQCAVLAATPALEARVGVPSLKGRDAMDMVFSAFVDETQPAVDGLWWDETYAPASLSAPRGGIFRSRLDTWERRQSSTWPSDAPTADSGLWRKCALDLQPLQETVPGAGRQAQPR